MTSFNWAQYKAVGRHVASYAAGGITAAAAIGLLSQGDASTLTNALNNIMDGLAQVAKGVAAIVGVLTPIYTAWRAAHNASSQAQIAAVAAMPEVKGIVAIPEVANATPSEKVVATPAQIKS